MLAVRKRFFDEKRKWVGLTRWPCQWSSGEKVDMEVGYAFAPVRPVVDNEAESFVAVANALGFCDLPGDE